MNRSNKNRSIVIAGLMVLTAASVVMGVLVAPRPRQMPDASRAPAAPSPVSGMGAPSAPAVPPVQPGSPSTQPIQEMRSLPEKVSVPGGKESALLKKPDIPAGTQRLRDARPLTSPETDGTFLAPRWSPDGLQILASGPGYRGIYLLSATGGKPTRLSEGNGYRAKWTADGKIEVPDEDGHVQRYNPDGSLDPTSSSPAGQDPVYSENDTIYARPQPGEAPVALTGGEDRYLNPVLSPDGKYVVYQGLTTGLFLSPIDGSQPPVSLGSGAHPSWMPDSGGFVYEVTQDDGHNLTGGDIYYTDVNQRERTNLTQGQNGIAQMPSVSPDGRSVVFESDGRLYVGEIR